MFERFTHPVTVMRMILQGDVGRLRRVIAGGAKIDRRTTYDPWMTPLDAAASTLSTIAAELLLSAGAPICGSSIYEAIQKDGVEVLQLFHRFDPKFYLRFQQEANNRHNPRLNRWMSTFTALDFAISINATKCANYISVLGAQKHSSTKRHGPGCTAILIQEESFIIRGGVNVDGFAEVTTGYYCAKCERFVP